MRNRASREKSARGALPFVLALVVGGVGSAGSLGCRIGGPTDEPDTVSDASVGAGDDAKTADAPGTSQGTQDTGGPSSADAGGGSDAGALGDGAAADTGAGGDGASIVDSGGGGGDGACSPTAAVSVCDPVCNTGCTGLTRCDVADNVTFTGACIGIWIQGVGTGCIKTPTTDPCAVNLACVDGTCQKLCWHDSDCAGNTSGTCCKAPVDATGFKSCAACGP